MNAFIKALAAAASGRVYVFQPMAKRYRLKKIVNCPETDQAAEILFDAYPGKQLSSIRNCSLWPSRRGCTQRCLTQAAVRPGR
jgi:hypothetical protein